MVEFSPLSESFTDLMDRYGPQSLSPREVVLMENAFYWGAAIRDAVMDSKPLIQVCKAEIEQYRDKVDKQKGEVSVH